MTEFLKDNWDKILSFVVAVASAILVVYKRFIRVESMVKELDKKLDKHTIDDDERFNKFLNKMDQQTEDIKKVTESVIRHDVLLNELRVDLREIRTDIKKLLEKK